MEESRPETAAPVDFLQPWLDMMNQALSGFFSGLRGMQAGSNNGGQGSSESHARTSQEALMSIFKTWGTLSSAMSEPTAASSIAGGMATLPDVMTRFFQTGINGFLKAQEQAMQKIRGLSRQTEAYRFDNLDQDSLKAWSDFYDKEIRQYLKVPQLGLVRFYQERFNQAVDRYNIMNARLGDFLQLLMLPMEKSFKVLSDKIEEQVRLRKVPEDPHEHYRLWVKILEGHYMTLFKSGEYTRALADTLSAFEEFITARNRIFADVMQSLPMPTNKDLDDLYDEIYRLKKRVKELEKSTRGPRKAPASGD
jgi:class III poly(R)-hydroxyalkanoic acid synthase PhaE subunit